MIKWSKICVENIEPQTSKPMQPFERTNNDSKGPLSGVTKNKYIVSISDEHSI